jgi:hypothetical protein
VDGVLMRESCLRGKGGFARGLVCPCGKQAFGGEYSWKVARNMLEWNGSVAEYHMLISTIC